MSQLNSETQTLLPTKLDRLGTYAWPRSETRQTLGHLFEKLKNRFNPLSDKDAIEVARIKRSHDPAFVTRIRAALHKALNDLLDQAFQDWIKTDDAGRQRRLLVFPPMTDDILTQWAERQSLPVLTPDQTLSDFADRGRVIVPSLEPYFDRTPDGLARLSAFLEDISRFDGKVLVGCNSWAWRFLQQFDDANLLFELAEVFPAFDAKALAEVLASAIDDVASYRSTKSGNSVFARDDDGALSDPYFENLAGCSLGLPWVAVEMFLNGFAETDADDDDANADTTWITLPAPQSLPPHGAAALQFALHALLIHGPRKIDDLNALLPSRLPNGTWAEMQRIGFIKITDGCAQCAVAAYPDIRSELSTAGFNLDKL